MADIRGARWAGERFGKIIEETLYTAAVGEPVEWDFSPVIFPSAPTGMPTAQPACGYLLILSCRSLLLSPPRIAVFDVTWDATPGDAGIREMVKKAVTSLYQVRRDLVHNPTAQGPN